MAAPPGGAGGPGGAPAVPPPAPTINGIIKNVAEEALRLAQLRGPAVYNAIIGTRCQAQVDAALNEYRATRDEAMLVAARERGEALGQLQHNLTTIRGAFPGIDPNADATAISAAVSTATRERDEARAAAAAATARAEAAEAAARAAAGGAGGGGGGGPNPQIEALRAEVAAITALPPLEPPITDASIIAEITGLPELPGTASANTSADRLNAIRNILATVHTRQEEIDRRNALLERARASRDAIDAAALAAADPPIVIPGDIPSLEEALRTRIAYMKVFVNDPIRQGVLNGRNAGQKRNAVNEIRTAAISNLPVPLPAGVALPGTTAELRLQAAPSTQFGGRAQTARRRYRARQKTQRRRRVRFASK